jgi:hypothetical protein
MTSRVAWVSAWWSYGVGGAKSLYPGEEKQRFVHAARKSPTNCSPGDSSARLIWQEDAVVSRLSGADLP